MALTKPRFQRHMHLEPLPQREITNRERRYCVHKVVEVNSHTTKETLPPISHPPKMHEYKKEQDIHRDVKKHSYEAPYKISTTENRTSPEKNTAEKHWSFNSNKTSDSFNSPRPDRKPTLSKVFRGVSRNNKVMSDSGSSKRVSFTIPSMLMEERHYDNQDNTNHSKVIDKKVVSSTIPMRRYHVTKQENTTTKSIETPSPLRHYEFSQQTKTFPGGKQRLDYEQAYKTIKHPSKENRNNLVQKIHSRRARGYVVSHRLPKLPRNTGISHKLTESAASHVSMLQKARQMLLEKMHSSNYVTQEAAPKRRVLFLPSLAAPCSEEFAITMRRTHGQRYISSPAILDHVMTRNVPIQATASFLDAILRPPSRLIVF